MQSSFLLTVIFALAFSRATSVANGVARRRANTQNEQPPTRGANYAACIIEAKGCKVIDHQQPYAIYVGRFVAL